MICEFSDLPVDQCACAHCKPDVNEYADVVIVKRFPTRFPGTLDCGHRIPIGDMAARTADGQHICDRCSR